MMNKTSAALTQNPRFLNKVYNRYLIPTMLVSLGTTINVFFDGIIVGKKLGSDSLAAVNLCMPIYLIMCTIGSLIGSGGFILSSYAIGNGKIKKSNAIYNTVVLYMMIVGVVVTFTGLILIKPITLFISGGNDLYDKVYSYAFVTILGALPKMFLYIPLFYLRLDGKNTYASFSTIIMTVTNIILDIVFVFVFNKGIEGVAIASVISTFIACFIGICGLNRSENLHIDFHFEKPGIIFEILKSGSPAASNNLMSAVKILVLNSLLLSSGGSKIVSVYSIINNISEISLFIVDGIPQTAASIIGIYFAEQSYEGIKILMKHQYKIGILLTFIFGMVIFILSGGIADIFGISYQMKIPIGCLGISIVFACINRIMISYYNSTGKNALSNVLTTARLVLFPAAILSLVLKSGFVIWSFIPAGEICTFILLILILVIVHIRHNDRSFFLLLNDNRTCKCDSLEFSVVSTDEDICNASAKISDFCHNNNISQKNTMKISLAIEEILIVMNTNCFDQNEVNSFDLRVFAYQDNTGIRIRCLGKRFNPVCDANQEDDMGDKLSIKMIVNIAKSIEYNYIFGSNNLLIII